MKRILVIDEGHPGHLTQSRGLANALAGRVDGHIEVFAVRMILRGFLRPLLRVAVGWWQHGLPDFLLRLAYQWSGQTRPLQADIVIASGGQGLPFATSLARRLGARLVFCGDPAPWPAQWCDVVLSPVPVPRHPAVVLTELLLTGMSPEQIVDRGNDYRAAFGRSRGSNLGAVLIGGDSRSHQYTAADWQQLAAAINRLGEQGWRWLLSTSRRTPPEVEQELRRNIDPRWLIKAVWWHAQAERVILDFLGAADVVFVTQDSLSMLSEAMAVGKPVVSLLPAVVHQSAFLEAVLSAQESRQRMVRVPILELAAFNRHEVTLMPVTHNLVEDYAAAAQKFLGW